jgi:hypothetical protein
LFAYYKQIRCTKKCTQYFLDGGILNAFNAVSFLIQVKQQQPLLTDLFSLLQQCYFLNMKWKSPSGIHVTIRHQKAVCLQADEQQVSASVVVGVDSLSENPKSLRRK